MPDMGWQHLTAGDKSAIVRGVRDGVAYGGPFHVEIYPADRCNIDCFFCSTAAIRGTDELPLQRIEELITELEKAGTRAIRFGGGGEPLFHRKTKAMLRAIAAAGIPIENITTNAVLLDEETAEILTTCCDEVTVSLNTGEAASYAQMMQTPERNFDRVLKNVRTLVEVRNRRKTRRPVVHVQFLIWRDNFRDLLQMYELALDLGADAITFNGLSFLRPDQEMSDSETAELLRLYEEVIRRDEFRRIRTIGNFERDISGDIAAISARLSVERQATPLLSRLRRFVTRNDFTLREKVAHHLQMRRNARADRETSSFDEACVIGWYSMVVRSDGTIAPCCILQSKPLGNIFKSSLDEIWNGDEYRRFRRELTAIIGSPDWMAGESDRTVEALCGNRGTWKCPMKSFYFNRDVGFVRELQREFQAKRNPGAGAGDGW
jgi:MoaA/NifB/PqqE/SkfB family radical SAM enzyme